MTENKGINIFEEQFIPHHLFVYVAQGGIRAFDGNKTYTFKAGECGIARKNSLAKYTLLPDEGRFEPILFCFDDEFLQAFQHKHKVDITTSGTDDTFINIASSALIENFIRSLEPYHKGGMQYDETFEDLKYEELLIILLRNRPELSAFFFDFDSPQKINLESFMNRNFRFNVSLERFAYLTGRSLSAFKRDFKTTFNDSPGHWLVQKRLHEAYFLIDKKMQRTSDIYLDLGFESLSHFSVAFKKEFGITPTELTRKRNHVANFD